MANDLVWMLDFAEKIAQEKHDGHLTILRFATEWTCAFGTITEQEEINKLPGCQTLQEARASLLAEALTGIQRF